MKNVREIFDNAINEDGSWKNGITSSDVVYLKEVFLKKDTLKSTKIEEIEKSEHREMLRNKFKEEMSINWVNEEGEPDIDYVLWLEKDVYVPVGEVRTLLQKLAEIDISQEEFGYLFSDTINKLVDLFDLSVKISGHSR